MRTLYKFLIFLANKPYVLVLLLILAIGLGFSSYYWYYELPRFRAISETINLFVDAVSTPIGTTEHKEHITRSLDLASILAKFTLFFTVIMIFIKEKVDSNIYGVFVKKGNHVLVIGLDKNSRFLINSEIKKANNNIVVVENDTENPYIKIYRDKGIPVLHEEIDSVIDKIGIDSAKYIFVSTGDSQENIATALKVIKHAQTNPHKKLLIHIEDRALRSLYNDGSLLDTPKLDIQPFSYFKESARTLFQEHDIDGDDLETINSNQMFEIAVVGVSSLAIEVIIEAIKVSSLPNENKLFIYCISPNKAQFRKRVEYQIPYINDIPHIECEYIELDPYSIEFYGDPLWKKDTLKHLILCHKKTVDNVNTFSKLKRITYGNVFKKGRRKIHIATYNDMEISKGLNLHNKTNDDVFVFAKANQVCSVENLVDTPLEKIAKMIEYSYRSSEYDKQAIVQKQKIIERVWEGSVSINDKRSCMAQAKHIKVKLKALGLKYETSNNSTEDLVEANNALLDSVLKEERQTLKLNEIQIHELADALKKHDVKETYTINYFPKAYKTLFEKLLQAEHKRWITMLILMNNKYDKQAKTISGSERKLRKIHHLMKPFDAFEEDEKVLILYDLYSILYIPEFLACVGVKIVRIPKV